MEQTVNGVSTDWRVTKAVADLVRARNPTGKILVMEGSVIPTATAFSLMGYTSANFGNAVDEFIAVEGASCSDQGTAGLEQRTSASGLPTWVNQRYVAADVVDQLADHEDASAGRHHGGREKPGDRDDAGRALLAGQPLTKLEASGFGTTDVNRITVQGKQASEVARAFAGRLTEICPGH